MSKFNTFCNSDDDDDKNKSEFLSVYLFRFQLHLLFMILLLPWLRWIKIINSNNHKTVFKIDKFCALPSISVLKVNGQGQGQALPKYGHC